MQYPVNIKKLVEILAVRTYSNQLFAGVREAIANAMDYNAKKVWVTIVDQDIEIANDGHAIKPEDILNYATIASDHPRTTSGRGEFGFGHLCLLGLSQSLMLESRVYRDTAHRWIFNSNEFVDAGEHTWRKDYLGNSPPINVLLVYRNVKELKEKTLNELRVYLRSVFSIPLYKNTLEIFLNGVSLSSLLLCDVNAEKIKTKFGVVTLYYMTRAKGNLWWCHKNVAVRQEEFSSLFCYIDEDFLDLSLSKEAYTTTERYHEVKKIVAARLQRLIPKKPHSKILEEFSAAFMKLFYRQMKPELVEKNPILPLTEREKGKTKGTHPKGTGVFGKQRRLVKGVKGVKWESRGLEYPFLWIEAATRTLIFNETHPVTKALLDRFIGGRDRAHFRDPKLPLSRAFMCTKLLDTEYLEKIEGAIVESDKILAKVE